MDDRITHNPITFKSIDINQFMDYDSCNPYDAVYWKSHLDANPLRNISGIYAFTICDIPVYIGSSTNLFGRFITHLGSIVPGYKYLDYTMEHRKYYYFNKYVDYLKFKVLESYTFKASKQELEKIEYGYINLLKPAFNINYGIYKRSRDEVELSVSDLLQNVDTLKLLYTQQND